MELTLFLSLFMIILQCSRLGKSESILIIVLPQNDTEMSASWERGEEILPGIKQAIEEAKNDALSFNVKLIEANSGSVTRYDLPYSGNVLEVIAMYYNDLTRQKRDLDIIAGVFHPNVLGIINRIFQLELPVVSLVHFNEAPLYNVHYATALTSTLTDSILAFLKEIHSKRIGIITEIKQPYMTISNELSTNLKANMQLNIQIVNKHHKSLSAIADNIFASNVHVILLSVGPSTAVAMLCEAYKRGLTWPSYAWILHSYRLEDLLRSSWSNANCTVEILEGIFIFQLTKERNNFTSETAHLDMHNDGFNPYADLLYNSVRALISSEDDYSNSSHSIYIYHSMNGTASLAGIFDGTAHTLTNVSEITFTDNDLPIEYKPATLVPYLLPLPILCFLFNTILLALYIIFRNEPTVKSTSVSLSMLIFTGCYLLIVFTIIMLLHELNLVDLCMAKAWLCGVGVSLPLILASILVKMLRVYRIFTASRILKQSARSSDLAFFVYTILITLPNIAILTIWTIFGSYHSVISYTEHPGFVRMELSCFGDNTFLIFYGLLFIYFFLLLAAVVIVAVKSRNIRRAHFKDTKKVNLLTSLLFIIATCTFAYWNILLFIDLYLASLIISYTGHLLVAFICQITLFVPKLWPSIQKKITKTPIHEEDSSYRSLNQKFK